MLFVAYFWNQSPFVTLFLMFLAFVICSSDFKLDQKRSRRIRFIIWLKLVQIGSTWFKSDQLGSNWLHIILLKSDKIGSNWINSYQVGSNWGWGLIPHSCPAPFFVLLPLIIGKLGLSFNVWTCSSLFLFTKCCLLFVWIFSNSLKSKLRNCFSFSSEKYWWKNL